MGFSETVSVQKTADRLRIRVRHLRESRGLTQEQMAEKCGLGYKYYQAYEAGRRTNITLETLDKFSAALQIPPHKLLDPAYAV